jgi:hypothetical protein
MQRRAGDRPRSRERLTVSAARAIRRIAVIASAVPVAYRMKLAGRGDPPSEARIASCTNPEIDSALDVSSSRRSRAMPGVADRSWEPRRSLESRVGSGAAARTVPEVDGAGDECAAGRGMRRSRESVSASTSPSPSTSTAGDVGDRRDALVVSIGRHPNPRSCWWNRPTRRSRCR